MKFLGVLVIVFGFQNVFASGDAGCGLGSVIISKNSKGLQLLAMTTNHSLLTQPLGITFGTSNCSASGLVSNEREKEYFVQNNFTELQKNIARGEGESLSTFAALNGCQSIQAKSEFSNTLKTNMSEILPNSKTTSLELVSNVNAQIEKNQNLKTLCTAKVPGPVSGHTALKVTQ